ncbi:uncharacterized protein LOC132619444 [Lycium barbarum]|uniref:uncharacterized protein LOC132619444 n=1 Tax=Lycium barbarum TaxID=112863 RepID=UPI00293EA408|nr:uncharacterized protein LOC132619444 [Lycium barbarum]
MGDHLPRDLLTYIFSRLGVKQLCKLKCLPKEWLNTISSPHFKKQHLDQSKKRPTLSLISSPRSNYSFLSQLFWARLVMFLPNWLSGKNIDLQSLYQKDSSFAHAFWLCWSSLGYVSSTNEYKIVASYEGKVKYADGDFYTGFEESLCFNILTLKLEEETSVVGSWRDLLLSCTQYSGTCHQPIHINGFIYWLAFAKYNTLSSDHVRILEMNLENEEIKTFCCPNGFSDFGFSHLSEINGHLCLVQNKRDGHMLNIWMLMAHESEAWCLEYSIEVHESASHYNIIGYLPRNNESTGDILIRSLKGDLFCYETDTKSFKELQSLNIVEYKWCALFYDSFFSIGLPGN